VRYNEIAGGSREDLCQRGPKRKKRREPLALAADLGLV